jgi:hypothetical protein
VSWSADVTAVSREIKSIQILPAQPAPAPAHKVNWQAGLSLGLKDPGKLGKIVNVFGGDLNQQQQSQGDNQTASFDFSSLDTFMDAFGRDQNQQQQSLVQTPAPARTQTISAPSTGDNVSNIASSEFVGRTFLVFLIILKPFIALKEPNRTDPLATTCQS